MGRVPRPDVRQQHPQPAAEVDREFPGDGVAGRYEVGHGLRGLVRVQAVPDRVRPQRVALARQQLGGAHRPVHLHAREGGRAQDVVEVGVGECDVRHGQLEEFLYVAADLHALAQRGARVDDEHPLGARDRAHRRVPARQPAAYDARREPLPPRLRAGVPLSLHTPTLAAERYGCLPAAVVAGHPTRRPEARGGDGPCPVRGARPYTGLRDLALVTIECQGRGPQGSPVRR